MTRAELIALGATKVRRNNNAISAFKEYLKEDWGQVPAGCFGCSFKNHFSRWVREQRLGEGKKKVEPKKKTVMSQTEKTSYKLKDKKFRAYFKGAVLSNESPDSAWQEWIKHLKGHRTHRESFFEKLPGAKKKVTPKAIKENKADKASAASAKSKADAPKKRKATKKK